MSDQEVSPIFYNLTCATDSDRVSPVSITNSSNGSQTSNASSTNRPVKVKLRRDYKRRNKLPYSYVEMITMAIKSSSSGRITLRDITKFMQDRFPRFRGEYVGWKNSVKYNLSASECFTKILRNSSRPRGKHNFWTMNAECEHCKNNRENDAVRDRILSNFTPITDLIPPLSPASSESATEPADTDNQTKLLNHSTTEMSSCELMTNGGTNTAAPPEPEAHYDDSYYHYQRSYTAHHGSRRHHRYHPYTHAYRNIWQQGRHRATQQGTNTVATIEDLYVEAPDIDFSMMYNNSKTLIKEQPEYHVPYATYHPTGFQCYETPYYNPYVDYHLPTPYQLPQHQYDWQRATPVDNREDGYVYPYPYDAQQVCGVPSFPSSPSSIHSSDSSSSCSV